MTHGAGLTGLNIRGPAPTPHRRAIVNRAESRTPRKTFRFGPRANPAARHQGDETHNEARPAIVVARDDQGWTPPVA